MTFGLSNKKEIKTKSYDLGKTVASVLHNDGTIYFLTKTGRFYSLMMQDDFKDSSEELLHAYLKKDGPLKMDCGTLIFTNSINRITTITTSHMVEGRDYGNS